MRRRIQYRVRAAWMLLGALLATTLLPRDAWYVHRHAASAAGHVHASGEAPGDDAWWEELLAESTAHHHAQGHVGHRHAHAPAHEHPRPATDHDASGPSLIATTGVAAAHAHWQAPFQTAAQAALPASPFLTLAVSRDAPATSPPTRGHRVRLRARAPPRPPVRLSEQPDR